MFEDQFADPDPVKTVRIRSDPDLPYCLHNTILCIYNKNFETNLFYVWLKQISVLSLYKHAMFA
jgi:hypothetical protein